MPSIAWATGARFAAADPDLPRLADAARRAGVDSRVAVWDAPGESWDDDLVVVRSCWDYVPRRSEFLTWAQSVPRLANPAATIGWNTDKTYLAELATLGVAVVPTAWNATQREDLPAADAETAWVVKPTVSAGSADTARWSDVEQALEHSRALVAAGRPTMVQPYLDAVDRDGETGLLFFGGRFSHAFVKGALLEPDVAPRAEPELSEHIAPRTPRPDQVALAERVLEAATRCLGDEPLYARIDLVDGPDGAPRLLELELTEPSFFLEHAGPEAADALVAAALARIG
jgi:hypothetical protein